MRKFKPGDVVRDVFGKQHEVQLVRGVQVWVGCNTWVHPTNLTLVKRPKPLGPVRKVTRAQARRRNDRAWAAMAKRD